MLETPDGSDRARGRGGDGGDAVEGRRGTGLLSTGGVKRDRRGKRCLGEVHEDRRVSHGGEVVLEVLDARSDDLAVQE